MTTKIGTLLKKLGTQDGRSDLHEAIDQWVGDRFGITGQQARELDKGTGKAILLSSLPVLAASTMGPFFTITTALACSAIIAAGGQEFIQDCNLRNRGLDIESQLRRVVKKNFDGYTAGQKEQNLKLEP